MSGLSGHSIAMDEGGWSPGLKPAGFQGHAGIVRKSTECKRISQFVERWNTMLPFRSGLSRQDINRTRCYGLGHSCPTTTMSSTKAHRRRRE